MFKLLNKEEIPLPDGRIKVIYTIQDEWKQIYTKILIKDKQQ
jgi:hypothetical protein